MVANNGELPTGILFICLNIDHLILWLPLNTENVEAAYTFYAVFYNAPPAIRVSHVIGITR